VTPDIGTELTNPKAGTKTVFTATAASTGGGYVEIEATYPPGAAPPPRHLHPSQEEHFTVLSGRISVIRGDEEFVAEPGTEFTVPAGTPHQMWPSGDDGAVMRWRTTPALRTGEMFCALWETARAADWQPDVLALLNTINEFADEFCLC
jgi:mannose-6-phosphate isomerase-like protein (cupin superfamily)